MEKLGVVNAFGGGLKSLSLGNTDQSVGIIMCGSVVRAPGGGNEDVEAGKKKRSAHPSM